MSLDVYLTLPGAKVTIEARIFIREDGQNKEITRAEWNARFPGREPYTLTSDANEEVYSANITHNLNAMAAEAGIYEALWRPEEVGIAKAEQLIAPLRAGLALLLDKPEHFHQFNPKNGWGNYEGLVQFVTDYVATCAAYPTADVSVSR